MTASELRLGYAGTPALAAAVLENLLQQGFSIDIILTQPDRQAGRGRKILHSPVKNIALQHNLPVLQPLASAEIDPDYLETLDLLIVVAYGMLLPEKILNRPKLGCINLHTSLLPRWRGAAPIQRAIEAGDKETGVSIMQMDTGLDTGPVLARKRCVIAADETSGTLHDKLSNLGAQCLVETLNKIAAGVIIPEPQDGALATYARKITKEEARLDWSRPANTLERQVRAFNPSPVAFTEINGSILRIWESAVIDEPANGKKPGTIVACSKSGVDIATGNGLLRLLKVQSAGKRIMTIQEFLNGHPDFFKQ